MMIDLHTHSIFSDGVLIPAELARRAERKGIRVLGITDHGDMSNMDFIIPRIVKAADALSRVMDIRIIPGIEITHVPPPLIPDMAIKARALGARLVIVHGQTIAEPVAPGTNRAALESDIDILAHPGLISREDAELARDRGVLLEISARKGHCLANGHVAKMALETGARMVLNTDSHAPGDLIDMDKALQTARGAGLSRSDFEKMIQNASTFS
jgi:putative hydrolase